MQLTENLSIEHVYNFVWEHGHIFSKVIQGKEKTGIKFSDYFDTHQSIQLISPHHALLLLQGRREGILRLSFKLLPPHDISILSRLNKQEKTQLDKMLVLRLREVAEKKALELCIKNLRERLNITQIQNKIIMSFDTSIRAGVKVAIIDSAGNFLDATHLHMYPPLKDWYASIAELAKLVIKHHVDLIAIGSGPAFREISRLVNTLIKMYPDLKLTKQTTHITGTPPYSSNETCDESVWTAVSIARQLRDPFTELLKIDPLTINVGPYQQDVRPAILKIALENAIKEYLDDITQKASPAHTKKLPLKKQPRPEKPLFNTAMADALSKLRGQS